MRSLIKLLPILVIMAILGGVVAAQVTPVPVPEVPTAKDKPGGYSGPIGTGTPGAHVPTGGGETGPYQGPGGGGEPGTPGTPPGGGGSSGGGSGGGTNLPPVNPPGGFPPPVGNPGGNGGSGSPPGAIPPRGVTGPLGQGYGEDSWQNWWTLNEGWLLDIERRYRRQSEAREISRDLFAGDVDPEAASPIEARGLAARRQTLPLLKQMLEHEHVRVRSEAAIAIGRAGSEEQVAWLAPVTKDRERDVRKAAIAGLGLLRQKAGLPYLEHILRDRGAQIIERAYAALAIGMIGDPTATDFLIERLGSGQRVLEIDAALLYALGLIENDARARRYLEDYVNRPLEDDLLRSVAVMGLGLQRSPESFESLLGALSDNDVRVRRSTAIALGQLDYASPYREEWDELETSILRDGGEVASDRVLGELESYRARLRVKLEADEKRLDEMRDRAVTRLAEDALEDSDIMVRNFAMIALGEIGGDRALALLRAQLYDARLDSTKAFAAFGMAVHGGATAGEQVHQRLARRAMDQETKGAMMLALGLLNETEAIDLIRKQFRAQGDTAAARASAIALGLLGDEKIRDPLQEMFFSRSRPELKRAYGQALALIGDYEMIEMAGRALRERGSVTGKVEIALALAQVYDQRSLGTLIEVADPKRRKDFVLAAIVRALGLLSERGERPLTAPMFRHLNYTLRFQALNEMALI